MSDRDERGMYRILPPKTTQRVRFKMINSGEAAARPHKLQK
jgi:hypothetical protein